MYWKIALPGSLLYALLLGASFLCLPRSGYSQVPKRPNILIIFSDDHAYQAISAYGSKLIDTPHLDRLAKEGIRFDRCLVTNSI